MSKVHDGDSLWLALPERAAIVVVRLQGLDAPEICQAWGPQAREALASRVLHRAVVLHVSGTDPHGRTLGRVWVDGEDVGLWMVRQGHAWSLRQRAAETRAVAQAERSARSQRLGLHAEPAAQPPWAFRRAHGPCPTPPRPRSR